MRIVDIIYAIPYILIVIVLLSVFGGPNTPNWIAWLSLKIGGAGNQGLSQIFLLFLALGLVSWLTMARVVRGQVLSLKNQEFILAAKATGVSTFGIIFRHLVPNTLGPVIVYATLTVPSVMLTEAFLSFLGLGVQAPYASWGSLASDGIKNIAIFPWQLIFPGETRGFDFSFHPAVAKPAGNEHAGYIFELAIHSVLDPLRVDQFQIDPTILAGGGVR